MRKVTAAALAIVLASARVAADPEPAHGELPSPHVRLLTGPGVLSVPSIDHIFDVPQGSHIVTPKGWEVFDLKIRDMGDQITRLDAENRYMKKRVQGWQPGWRTLTVATITGIVTGVYLGRKL